MPDVMTVMLEDPMHGAGMHDEELGDKAEPQKGRTPKVKKGRNKQVGVACNEYETESESAIGSEKQDEQHNELEETQGTNRADPETTRLVDATVDFMKHILWNKYGQTDVIHPDKTGTLIPYIVMIGLKHVRVIGCGPTAGRPQAAAAGLWKICPAPCCHLCKPASQPASQPILALAHSRPAAAGASN